MGKTIEDIGLPKDLVSKKKLNLYKAFVITNPDEKMEINQNIEILYTDFFTAVGHFLDQYSLEELDAFKKRVDAGDYPTVSYVIISVDLEDLRHKPLVDEGEPYYENDQMAITLADKMFEVSVEDALLTKLEVTVDPETDERRYVLATEGYEDKEKQEKRRKTAISRKKKKESQESK